MLFVQGTSTANPFTVASSTGSTLFTVLANGNVGIASSTPGYNLGVTGSLGVGATSTFWGRVGIGTSSPIASFSLTGTAGVNAVSIASSTGATMFSILQTGTTLIGTSTAIDSSKLIVQGTSTFVGTAGNITAIRAMGNIDNTATSTFAPRLLSTLSVGTTPQSVFVSGKYVYVANNGSNTMSIIDASNPTNPATISTPSTGGGNPYSIYVSGRYAYVVNNGSSTLAILDVSNPASATLVSTTTTGSAPRSVFVAGRYAYVANFSGNTMSIIDISNPSSPVTISTPSTGTGPTALYVSGRVLS